MKRWLLALSLLFLSASAHANSYCLVRVTVLYDSSFGTWTSGGRTLGAIVGAEYIVSGTDGAGNVGYYTGNISIAPRTSWPSSTAVKNAILTDAQANSARAKIDAQIAAQAINTKQAGPAGADIPIEGQALALP